MSHAWRVLRRRLPLFLLCVALVPAAAAAGSLLLGRKYSATATLLLRDPQFDLKVAFGQNQFDLNRQTATNLELFSMPRVAALTAGQLRGVSEDQVLSEVTENNIGQSNLVSIQATASTPSQAARVANTFASQYIVFRRDANRSTIDSAELPLQRELSALPPQQRSDAIGQSLQSRLSALRVLSSLQSGDAKLVQPAEIPRAPSSPKPARNAALGLFFGAVLGLAVVLLAEALDRRLRDPEELERLFGQPLLVTLPGGAAASHVDVAELTVSEPFRVLWAYVHYFMVNRAVRSVLITSADRDDAKSTVAWGVAAAAANAGKRSLVIKADSRDPTFSGRFEVSDPSGLTDALSAEVGLRDAVRPYRFSLGSDAATPSGSLDMLLAGSRPSNHRDLLPSDRLPQLLREAHIDYDLIVIDSAPATAVSDLIPLITLVDGVIVVGTVGHTLRDPAHQLRRQLGQLEAPVLGVVVSTEAGPVNGDEGNTRAPWNPWRQPTPAAPEANGGGASAVASSGSTASGHSEPTRARD